MDDVLRIGPDKATVRGWATLAAELVTRDLGLMLKPEATIVAPVHVELPYLAFAYGRASSGSMPPAFVAFTAAADARPSSGRWCPR